MQTLYKVVKEVEKLVNNHPQLTSFYYGDSIQLDTKTDALPALLVEPQPSNSGRGFAVFTILLTVFDIPKEDRSDDLETDSKLFDIIQDVVGQFINGDIFKNHEDYSVGTDIAISPSQPRIDKNDRMLAWSASIDVTVKYRKTGWTDSIIQKGNDGVGIGSMEIGTNFIVR